jgi:hypothetical protein
MRGTLSAEQVAQYRRDGVLVVPGVVTGDELAELREAADRVTEEAVAHGRDLDRTGAIQLSADHGFNDWQPDDAGFLYGRGTAGERVFRRAELMWSRDVRFRAVTAHPAILGVVRSVLGADVAPVNDAMVVKMPGAGAAVPWHRDPPGPPLIESVGDASDDFTTDLYLDPSTLDNGCLWALPGSHRRGEHAGISGPSDPLDFGIPGAVPLEAQPGDLLLHSTGVLHGSPTNTSGAMRRTFYVQYASPATVIGGWWGKTAEWYEERAAFLRAAQAEREARSARKASTELGLAPSTPKSYIHGSRT